MLDFNFTFVTLCSLDMNEIEIMQNLNVKGKTGFQQGRNQDFLCITHAKGVHKRRHGGEHERGCPPLVGGGPPPRKF